MFTNTFLDEHLQLIISTIIVTLMIRVFLLIVVGNVVLF